MLPAQELPTPCQGQVAAATTIVSAQSSDAQPGVIWLPENIGQHLEILWIVTTGAGRGGVTGI